MNNIEEEKRTVGLMIGIYCRRKHNWRNNGSICTECEDLLKYSNSRLDECEFGDDKGPCKSCIIHCYKTDMRERMQEVMRFSGPRILFRHPIISIKHLTKRWDRI